MTLRRASAFNLASIALGLAFLYLPIAVLVIYSFNASRLVGIWGGWSTRWYAALLDDPDMLDSASISLRLLPVSRMAISSQQFSRSARISEDTQRRAGLKKNSVSMICWMKLNR